MDLIVFANGAARNISGLTKETTCAEVVYALAHATNQKGRFVLVSTFSDLVFFIKFFFVFNFFYV